MRSAGWFSDANSAHVRPLLRRLALRVRRDYQSEPCLTGAQLAITGEEATAAFVDYYGDPQNFGDLGAAGDFCGAIIVAANASLTISDCVVGYNAGYSTGLYTARVRTSACGFFSCCREQSERRHCCMRSRSKSEA